MKAFFGHIKKYILRGFFAIIPLALSYFAIKIVYVNIDKRVVQLFYKITGLDFPGLGILLLLITLYIIGFVVSNVVGRKIFRLIERVSKKLPLIKTTYNVGKQLAMTFSIPEKQVFKRVVLVDYLKPGIWTIGFVTGTLIDRTRNDEKLLKVFVPTPPNPTSGTMVLVRESEIRDPGWSIEEAVEAVISGGIIGPIEIK